MDLGLTHGEVVVLAVHLGVSPSFVVGERSATDTERLLSEGWRSLLARRSARMVGGEPELNSELVDLGRDIVSPSAIVTYSRISEEQTLLSTLLVGVEHVFSAIPISNEVTLFSSMSLDSAATTILGEMEMDPSMPGAYRLEIADRTTGEHRDISWVQLPGPRFQLLTDGETRDASSDELGDKVASLFRTVEGVSSEVNEADVS